MCVSKKERIAWITSVMKVHAPMRGCLGCETEPKLGYNSGVYKGITEAPAGTKIGGRYESFTFHCPKCGFSIVPYSDLQAAVTAWHRSNARNEAAVSASWMERYEELVRVWNEQCIAIGGVV